jgi:sigma-B regulation protein RsbU (phosphoserine phosphatase)
MEDIMELEDKVLEKFRSSLANHRDELIQWINDSGGQKDVHLGGTSVNDVLKVISELKETLEKIDQGTFGICEVCHEDVDASRLEMDYTACVCLEHLNEVQRRSLERDLELAGKVQRQLLACCTPSLPGVQISVFSKPAQVVGGDYYDFFGYPDTSQGIVIADVMGKGLSASMLMSNLQASLRIIGPDYDDPAKIARRLNDLFLRNLKLIRFISIFMGILDPECRTLRYCNAGHHSPLLHKAASGEILTLQPTGPAIGLSPDPEYTSESVEIEPGDFLLLYTDGIIENRNRDNEEFGEERLRKFLAENHKKSAEDFIPALVKTAQAFSSEIHDDVTLMALKRE